MKPLKHPEFTKHYNKLTPEQKKDLAENAGTSLAYLSQLSNGHRGAGVDFITRLLEGGETEVVFKIAPTWAKYLKAA